MATNSIFTNTSSGIDYQKIVEGFTKIEGARAEKLQQKTIDVTTRMSTLATMMGQARDLEDALTSLTSGVPLGIVGRQPLNVQAEVAADAPAGRYNVKVNTLAQAAQGRTQTFDSAAARVTAGTYNFVVDGKSFDFTLDSGATLTTLANKIAESGAPVQVSLINTGSGTTLSIVGANTGVSAGVAEPDQLRLTPPPPDPADPTATAPAFAVTQPAQNATIVVNGVDISRTTNVIDDVIPGVTLRTTNVGATETFEVGRDTTGLTDKVQAVVDTYNALRRAVKNQVEVAGGTDTAQLLTNDPVVRRLNRQMSDMLRIDVGAGSIRSLASVGINVARDGTLEFNAGKLKTTIIVDPTAVTNFLSGPNGYASRARTMISQFSNPLSGALSKRTFELSDDISKIQKEKAAADLKVEAFRDRLVRQFSTLQSVQSQMSGLTSFLKANDNAANKS
jgi:flagellar hook-associated protein 2